MRMLFACLAVVLPAPAFACENVDQILQLAYPDAKATADELIVKGAYAQRVRPEQIACKVWPSRPELTLLAVPLIEAEPAAEGEARGDVEVIVADTGTGKPFARLREIGMAFGDALQFAGVTLDTARYDIKAGIRAFGIVTRQEGSSRVNPYSESALWLYSFTDGRLDRVLDGLVTEGLTGENNGDCEGFSLNKKRTVSVEAGEHEGYRDLRIDQTEIASTSTKVGNDCNWIEKPGDARQWQLTFKDGRYRATDTAGEQELFSSIEIAP